MPNDDAVDRNLQGMESTSWDGTTPTGPASSLTITPTKYSWTVSRIAA